MFQNQLQNFCYLQYKSPREMIFFFFESRLLHIEHSGLQILEQDTEIKHNM